MWLTGSIIIEAGIMHKIGTRIPSGMIISSISAECVDHQQMSIQSLYQKKNIINWKHKNNLTLPYNITLSLINLSAIILYHFHWPAHHDHQPVHITEELQIDKHNGSKLRDHVCW